MAQSEGQVTLSHDHAVLAVAAADLYQPTAMPDRIILTLNGDPSTTQTVNWRTSVEVATGLAEIVAAEAGPYFPEKARQTRSQHPGTEDRSQHCPLPQRGFLRPGTGNGLRLPGRRRC